MNLHFHKRNDGRPNLPSGAFGRIDHVEFVGPDASDVLVAFDLIDSTWLRTKARLEFVPDDPDTVSRAWKGWQHTPNTESVFDGAPLFRLEMELYAAHEILGFQVSLDANNDDLDMSLGAAESAWFEFEDFEAAEVSSANGLLYGAMYGFPVPVRVKGKLPSYAVGKALSGLFNLSYLPTISTADFSAKLSRCARAHALAVYDVGQGNANALLGDHAFPSMYFDLGAGVYRNKATTPPHLSFCFTNADLVVLSHWDVDHWAGAFQTLVDGEYPALTRTWIAPDQKVGPIHIAFALEVIAAGGTFLIYKAGGPTIGTTAISGKRQASFCLGSGADRNGSGIVLAVTDQSVLDDPKTWLLTGDCDYKHFMAKLPLSNVVGLVVPHHGARVLGKSLIPSPAARAGYRRIAYSFGHDNNHGSKTPPTRHPRDSSIQAHIIAGWDHGGMWAAGNEGVVMPTADARATNEHALAAARHGITIGWSAPPVLTPLACGGKHCSAKLGCN